MPNNDPNQDALKTLEALARGGIPPDAEQRLKENAQRQGTPKHLFTSNLSVNELLLTHDCGYEPLGQVMGTTVYHVGYQYMSASGQYWSGYAGSGELSILSGAYQEARRLAFDRLTQEAKLLNADGVVGVRFETIGSALTEGSVEFKAVGTAVRKSNQSGPPRVNPFISNLNGQDHWALRKGGWDPLGFAFGNCSWLQVANWRTWSATSSIMQPNIELSDYTQGVYTAREIAMTRLEQEAHALGALGVVGVKIFPKLELIDMPNNQNSKGLIVQFMAYGTAIGWVSGRRPDVNIKQTLPLIK